ncbi:MAG: oxidoreductase [bacterium]|jgi:F420-non-reducing hydrogenase small subunit
MAKPKVAIYWAASCGGCEIAVLDIAEKILDLSAAVDIVFWPAAIDVKYKDVEAMEDGEIDLCLFNGGVRTTENEHLAHLLRRKSKILVAYGSCAHEGCIPGMANQYDKETICSYVYDKSPSVDNPDKVRPQLTTKVDEGVLTLPALYDTLKSLKQVVKVDYFVPGCPPTDERTWEVLSAVLKGALPAAGSVVGAGTTALCEDCPRERKEKKVKRFYRPHEIVTDPEVCLLDQGIICCGVVTRTGCGVQCPSVNMPCRGCYGPPDGVADQGAKLIAVLGSIIDSTDPEEIEKACATVMDPLGTGYRFGLANSILRRSKLR